MANNYQQTSLQVDDLTAEETEWIEAVLTAAEEEEFEPNYTGPANEFIREVAAFGVGLCFQYEIQGGSLWIYAEEFVDPEQVGSFLLAFLARFRPDDRIEFSIAWTCSKMRVGEFGGDTIVVTSENVYSLTELGLAAFNKMMA